MYPFYSPPFLNAGKPATPAAPIRPPVMATSRQAPPPETLDAKYIADVLGSPLTAALAEVAEKRPWDPIEYLAQWLYKHKANLDYHQRVSIAGLWLVVLLWLQFRTHCLCKNTLKIVSIAFFNSTTFSLA